MKRILSLLIVFIMLATLICSCSLLPGELALCNVNFYVDGKLYQTQTVIVGQTVGELKPPKKENQIFIGWGMGETISYKYDFSNKVITDLDLHAYYTIDAVALTNLINSQTMNSIVTLKRKSYNTSASGMSETSSSIAQGSGVVIDVSGGYCYVLTNSHVVDFDEDYSHHKIVVEDPWGNVYEAKVYKKASKPAQAKSEEYDLALICFEYVRSESSNLQEIAMGTDPQIDEYIVSLGTPGGLKNSISFGTVMAYQPINAEEGSVLNKLSFDIILHNSQINHGSSGGALVNTKGQLVGINFAGYNDGTYGCAIPISKVIEFMELYVY